METPATPSVGWWSHLKAGLKQINWREAGYTFALTWLWVTTLLFVVGLIAKISDSLAILPDSATVGILPNWFDDFVGRVRSRDVTDIAFWQHLFLAIVAAPLVEESIFRLLVCRVAEVTEQWKLKWPIVIVGSFILFGMLHPNRVWSIFIQGVAGLLLARLYLSYKGKSQLAAFASCVIVHAGYNFSVETWQVIRGWVP